MHQIVSWNQICRDWAVTVSAEGRGSYRKGAIAAAARVRYSAPYMSTDKHNYDNDSELQVKAQIESITMHCFL
jgi:hypothetical protein